MLIHKIKIEKSLNYLDKIMKWETPETKEFWYGFFRDQITKFDKIVRKNLSNGSIRLVAGEKNSSLEWETVTIFAMHQNYIHFLQELSKAGIDFRVAF